MRKESRPPPSALRTIPIGPGDVDCGRRAFYKDFLAKTARTFQSCESGNIGNDARGKNSISKTSETPMEAYLHRGALYRGTERLPCICPANVTIKVISVGTVLRFGPNKLKTNKCLFSDGVGQFHFLGSVHGHWDSPLDLSSQRELKPLIWALRRLFRPPKNPRDALPSGVHSNGRRSSESKDRRDGKHQRNDLITLATEKPKKPFTREDFETALKRASRKITTRKKSQTT